jgi:nitrogen fixation/metabolism regulation signal transduction histidine kinase
LLVPLEVAALFAGLALAAGFLWGRTGSVSGRAPDHGGNGAQANASPELLAAIVESAPVAVLVYGETGKISFSNREARLLFSEGKPLDGENFLRLVEHAPEALRNALLRPADALFSVGGDAQLETFSLARRELTLHGEPRTLLMVKELTPELGRQEVEVWKKVIRLINHELNNSLAPILSMVRSARFIVNDPEQHPKLEQVFETIEERAKHLAAFLEGYARFARLPRPKVEKVRWSTLVEGLRSLYPAVAAGEVPTGEGYFDLAQMQQALMNLLKNAFEASPEGATVELSVRSAADGAAIISVADRGHGMTPEVMKSALLPFFTTKESGSGLGLALAREIVEAHRGKLGIRPREGGGIEVSCWLPGKANATLPHTASLTLTRR